VVRIAGLRDPYRVRVQAYIDNVNRVPQTGCQEADLWRVGPRAVEWPASSTLVLPLDYASSLPDGVYAEQLQGRVLYYDRGLRVSGSLRRSFLGFEVVQGALRPLSAQAYLDYARPRIPRDEYGNVILMPSAGVPPSPCLDSPAVDDTPLEGASTIVDFDTWENAGSLQPFRVDVASKTLSYRTTSSADLTLQLELALPFDISSGEAHVTFGGASSSILELSPPSPGSRADFWFAASGSALIRSLEDGRLSVELSDVVLQNESDATPRRPVPPGSIVGDWIERP
jgi:hypothetical protein